jgi:tryptophan-rich sensory protein
MRGAGTIISLILFIALSMSAGFIGSRFTPGDWYEGLEKPAWNPPNYLFGPVWTVLYILMGVAAWIVWTRGEGAGRGLAISVFTAQLALNALWSYLFFGIRRPGLAFIEIIALWLAICATIFLFWKVRRPAAVLLFPYLAWVSFASALNFQLWRLNI